MRDTLFWVAFGLFLIFAAIFNTLGSTLTAVVAPYELELNKG
jgi:hypothetical protein